MIVDNRPGAASNIAAEIAAKAPADGYTLFEGSITHAVNASLYRKLPFNLMRDFAAVTQFASSPQVVVVHPSLPVKSLGELVKLAQARPGATNYASAGSGTSTFLAAELFKGQAGISLTHVPYRGGGAALAAALSGEASVYFAPVASSLPHIQPGRLRALAVTSAKRLPVLRAYPTVAESGYAGYECGNWYGVMVPVKTPRATITAIHSATITVLNQPEVNRRLTDLGYIVVGDKPEEFGAHIKSEISKLAKVVKDLNLSAE
ncbi:MAG: tripartite tricarboxylate transporter substrate binding protein [Betaproteobacteria bacterium]|nr:tripartite tricarboxylate transporter substrate binding protein [Betaproteobacteria bacterium]